MLFGECLSKAQPYRSRLAMVRSVPRQLAFRSHVIAYALSQTI